MDLCLSAPPITGDSIAYEAVLTEEIYVIVSPSHHLAKNCKIDLAELRDEAFVGLKTGYGMRDLMDHYCQIAGFVPRHTFEGDEPTTLRSMVQAELGIAFVPGISRNQSTGEDIVYLRIEPQYQRTTGLSWHKDRYLSMTAQAFRQMLVICYQKASQS